ncbi:hypothetical protein GDO81_010769 [Engystomops pustulosus]|uniref:Transposase n=1 Tax=Engystomops pustulosus TaxID=76066 RepID=A0AAV7C2T3_ENGPU|nr:hypothetical protein GDO81_010769 [Engystomops pustulosus]
MEKLNSHLRTLLPEAIGAGVSRTWRRTAQVPMRCLGLAQYKQRFSWKCLDRSPGVRRALSTCISSPAECSTGGWNNFWKTGASHGRCGSRT